MPPQATVGVRLRIAGQQAVKEVKTLGGKINAALGKIRPIASLIGGAGGIYMLQNLARKTIDFDLALTRMSIQAHKSKGDQAALRAEMIKVAEGTGIAKDQIAAAGQSIIDATGDFDFMRGVLKEVAIMSQVTGSDMAGMGNVVSDLKNLFGLTADEATQMMRVFTEQGEQGKWTLVEMATTMPKVLAGAKVAKAEGLEALKHVGAEMQIWRRGYATAEEAANSYKTTQSRLAQEAKKLEGKGVKVFEDDDPTKMRHMSDILTDIFQNVGKDATTLVELFGTENIAGITAMVAAYEQGGESAQALNKELDRFKKVTGEAGRMEKDLGRILDTTGGKMMTFQQKLDAILDEAMMQNINDLAGYLPELTKILKFIADNKEAILVFWAAQKLGGFTGGVPVPGGPAGGGPAGTPKAGGTPVTPSGYTNWAAAFAAGIGIGMGGAEVSKGGEKMQRDFASEIDKQEKATGKKMSLGEKIGLLFKGIDPKMGTGSQWQSPTEKAEQQLKFSQDQITALEEAVARGAERGASKAKPQVNMPAPLTPSGGTPGKPVHG